MFQLWQTLNCHTKYLLELFLFFVLFWHIIVVAFNERTHFNGVWCKFVVYRIKIMSRPHYVFLCLTELMTDSIKTNAKINNQAQLHLFMMTGNVFFEFSLKKTVIFRFCLFLSSSLKSNASLTFLWMTATNYISSILIVRRMCEIINNCLQNNYRWAEITSLLKPFGGIPSGKF